MITDGGGKWKEEITFVPRDDIQRGGLIFVAEERTDDNVGYMREGMVRGKRKRRDWKEKRETRVS